MTDSRYRDRVIKGMASTLVRSLTESKSDSLSSAKEFLAALASIAGKGKDDLVQTICREIGQATAAVLKEPIAEILKDRKLQVTIELVPLNHEKDQSSKRSSKKSRTNRSHRS